MARPRRNASHEAPRVLLHPHHRGALAFSELFLRSGAAILAVLALSMAAASARRASRLRRCRAGSPRGSGVRHERPRPDGVLRRNNGGRVRALARRRRRWRSPLTTPVFFSTPLVIRCSRHRARPRRLPAGEGGHPRAARPRDGRAGRRTPPEPPRTRGEHRPRIGALVVGCVSTLVVAVVLARALALSPTVTASIGVKSVTAPIAIDYASLVNGNPYLTAAYRDPAGIIGAMLGLRGSWTGSASGRRSARTGARRDLARAGGRAANHRGTTPGRRRGRPMGEVAAVLTALIAPVLVPLLM